MLLSKAKLLRIFNNQVVVSLTCLGESLSIETLVLFSSIFLGRGLLFFLDVLLLLLLFDVLELSSSSSSTVMCFFLDVTFFPFCIFAAQSNGQSTRCLVKVFK